MHPEFFGTIKSFGLMLAISFGLGMWLSVRRGRRYNIKSEDILDIIFGILISSIIGVRLAYVMTHLGSFHPWYRAFFIWDGGLTLYGGILAAFLAIYMMSRRRGIPYLVSVDILAPTVMLGLGITRIGCFLAGCCFGKPTDCSCAVTFPIDAPATRLFGAVGVHPAQLYSSGGGFLMFGLLLLAERYSKTRGATFARFLLMYGLARFLVDFSRYYEPEQLMALGWSNNQWISVGMMVSGIVLGLYVHRNPAPVFTMKENKRG